ncbi:hypothetical protein [Winslowiella toletana]|uniref:hypothetical protein n=1 Tax=Winslowiella toletana TaxID=92490 RepID=UPI0012FF0481|nr:hypothetical protein [Winslowiella toletana]
MNIDALQETTSSKKDSHYETRGETPLNIEKIINTPQALTFHLSRTYHRVPPSLMEASKSYSMVDKLKYVLDDYPSRPKNRALREMQEASLKTIADAILTKKTAVGDFSPILWSGS